MHPQSSASPSAKPILAAIDGSSHSHKVGAYAWRLASALGARLSFLHVVQHMPEPMAASLGLPAGQWMQSQLYEGQRLLDQLCSELNIPDADKLLLAGPVAETICGEAEDLDVQMIVLGAHGHGPMPRIMLGSVGDRVAALASRTVTIVR